MVLTVLLLRAAIRVRQNNRWCAPRRAPHRTHGANPAVRRTVRCRHHRARWTSEARPRLYGRCPLGKFLASVESGRFLQQFLRTIHSVIRQTCSHNSIRTQLLCNFCAGTARNPGIQRKWRDSWRNTVITVWNSIQTPAFASESKLLRRFVSANRPGATRSGRVLANRSPQE